MRNDLKHGVSYECHIKPKSMSAAIKTEIPADRDNLVQRVRQLPTIQFNYFLKVPLTKENQNHNS